MFTIGRRRARFAAQWRDDAQTQAIYFTDGVELFCVNRWLNRPVEPCLAEVENCRSLDRVLITRDDLARLPVRLVAVDEIDMADATDAANPADAPVPAMSAAGLTPPPDLVSPVA
ncbi:MAG TPA: hypothetical protein VG165_15440 [Solirubrobacteraceae bacterium]|jgi:hypothetical protein|nr:hypothetical protein [Solirubrobacteraceae bacterium]